MRILIEGKPVDALTPKLERSFMIARVEQNVKGRVLNPAEAAETYIGQTRRWFRILSGVAIGLMLIISVAGAVSDPIDGSFVAVGAIIIGGAFLLFMQLLLRRRIGTWNRKLDHRKEGLPPATTTVAIDAVGLTVGAEVLPWSDLSIDQMELSEGAVVSGDTSETVRTIERLSLRAGSRTVVLDRAMIENGPLLLDNIWRRLKPKAA